MSAFIFAVLVTAYVASIVGAVLMPSRRSWAREVADAVALPMTMFTSKHKRGRWFSAVRVILFVLLYFVVKNMPAVWNWPAVVVVLGIPGMLIMEPLFALVPVRELMLAAGAYLGSKIADRMPGTTTVEVDKSGGTKVTTGPAPATGAIVGPPANDGAPGGDAD